MIDLPARLAEALAWKLALTVNRLLQPPGTADDRASITGLLREVRAAQADGWRMARSDLLAEAETELARIREMPEVLELKRCRDEFMAHTVLGCERKGMQTLAVQDLSEAVEQVVNDFHFAITGEPSPLHDRSMDWLEWAGAWWERVMPEPACP